MRQRFFCIALAMMAFLFHASPLAAAPALPGIFTVRQPDGTLLTIEQFGDEYYHWTVTTDGTRVVREYGGIGVRSQESGAGSQESGTWNRAATISETGRYLPHTGSPRVLVILAAYQDVGFTVNEPLQAFDQYLNADKLTDLGNHNTLNHSSVREYFNASSRGAFTPQFDVVGPVTLPNEMAYYGKNENMSALCRDAVEQVQEQVDMLLYDNDDDGRAELVYIIFAGYGENQGGDKNAMWAKTSTQNLKVSDQLTITRFCCCSELFHPHENYKDYINGIGVFCHEFSHGMGLPDIYPTSSSGYVNNQNMETWDVMDQGLYNYNGFAPALYLAWEQEAMGWLTIKPLTDTEESLSLLPLEEGGEAYKLQNPDDPNEYIVMENIQQRGANYKAYGHGLLVYHVAYPYEVVSMTDSPNNKAGHPSVAVVPADGLVINGYQRESYNYGGTYTTAEYRASFAGDPFPGTSGTLYLSDQMTQPNFQFYASEDGSVGYSLNSITEYAADGLVVFDLVNERDEPIDGIREIKETGDRSQESGDRRQVTGVRSACYDLQGRRIDSSKLKNGLYIVNGRKVVIK